MEQAVAAPTPAVAEVKTAEPDFKSMTGAQAKAWVESQKQKKEEPLQAKPSKASDPYLNEPKKDQVTTDTVKEAVAEAKRKLKIDDQDIDEDEVIKIYRERRGHQQAANKALQEGNAKRKQAEELVTLLRDPDKVFDVLTKLGHDPRTLSEKKMVAVLQEEMMSPEEREFRDLRAEKKAREEADRVAKETAEKAEVDRAHGELKTKWAKDYTEQFTRALSETSLPATKYTVAEMAKYIADAAKIGYKLTAQDAAKLVREDLVERQKRLIGDTDGEMLIQLLGEDVANKIRKWDTGRLKNPEPPRVAPENQGSPREKRAPHKRMTSKEWREFNRR